MKMSVLRSVLGLRTSADEAEIFAATRALVEGYEATRRKLAVASTKLVELAISSHRLPYVRRKWALGLATRDPVGFAELVQNAPPAPSLERQITDAAHEKIAASADRLDLRAAIKQVGMDHPDLIEAYQAEKRAETRTQLRRRVS